MRWSVSIVAEGDRVVSHEEVVELAAVSYTHLTLPTIYSV